MPPTTWPSFINTAMVWRSITPRPLTWYRVAAEKGDKVSQFQIGLMYQIGQGVEANQEEAHRWFTMHRQHHRHHEHEPQMVAWRKQALVLIEERDRRKQATQARRNSQQVIAEPKRRAQPLERALPGQLAANTDQ
jgi:uncharacterized protein